MRRTSAICASRPPSKRQQSKLKKSEARRRMSKSKSKSEKS